MSKKFVNTYMPYMSIHAHRDYMNNISHYTISRLGASGSYVTGKTADEAWKKAKIRYCQTRVQWFYPDAYVVTKDRKYAIAGVGDKFKYVPSLSGAWLNAMKSVVKEKKKEYAAMCKAAKPKEADNSKEFLDKLRKLELFLDIQ